jgi:hypothetical protein
VRSGELPGRCLDAHARAHLQRGRRLLEPRNQLVRRLRVRFAGWRLFVDLCERLGLRRRRLPGLSGWTADAGSADVDHADGGDDDDNDFEGCPFSGSARLNGTASTQQRFAQCVNLDTLVATYNIGYSVKGERAFCAIERYTQSNCAYRSVRVRLLSPAPARF